jgi:hypothetical protein
MIEFNNKKMKLIILLSIILLATGNTRKVKSKGAVDEINNNKGKPFNEFSIAVRGDFPNDSAKYKSIADSLPLYDLAKESIQAKNLYPTQNEIGFGSSLAFQLYTTDYNYKSTEQLCASSATTPVEVNNSPLMVAKINNKYHILDGHHRWSQIFVVDPDCYMNVNVVSSFTKVEDALMSALFLQIKQDKRAKSDPTKLDFSEVKESDKPSLIGSNCPWNGVADKTLVTSKILSAINEYNTKSTSKNASDAPNLAGKSKTDIDTYHNEFLTAKVDNFISLTKQEPYVSSNPRNIMPQTDNVTSGKIPYFLSSSTAARKQKKLK